MKNDATQAIKARRFGSEGLMPVDKYHCPYRGTASCVSASGGSYCGGYGGDTPIKGTHLYAVRCLEEQNADFIPHSWMRSLHRLGHLSPHR